MTSCSSRSCDDPRRLVRPALNGQTADRPVHAEAVFSFVPTLFRVSPPGSSESDICHKNAGANFIPRWIDFVKTILVHKNLETEHHNPMR